MRWRMQNCFVSMIKIDVLSLHVASLQVPWGKADMTAVFLSCNLPNSMRLPEIDCRRDRGSVAMFRNFDLYPPHHKIRRMLAPQSL